MKCSSLIDACLLVRRETIVKLRLTSSVNMRISINNFERPTLIQSLFSHRNTCKINILLNSPRSFDEHLVLFFSGIIYNRGWRSILGVGTNMDFNAWHLPWVANSNVKYNLKLISFWSKTRLFSLQATYYFPSTWLLNLCLSDRTQIVSIFKLEYIERKDISM